MAIDVFPPSRQTLKSIPGRFALQQDNWNDFSFQTLYHLHYRQGREPDEVTYIGGVKILKRGQTKSDPLLIQKAFTTLGPEFCSVGTSLDYYQRLNAIPVSHRSSIVRALRDAVANPRLVDDFSSEQGWGISVFRDNPDWPSFLNDARILFEGNFDALPDMGAPFAFLPPNNEVPIEFDFSAPRPSLYSGPYRSEWPNQKKTLLPERIIILIGRNGSGKSTLLSRLARVAFASPPERKTKKIMALGQLQPPGIGFMRVITISYSAFDSFIVPGVAARDLTQITQDIESGEGRFVFCGLRDIVAEVRDDVDKAKADVGDEADLIVERRTSTRLKPIDTLATEFATLLGRIRKDGSEPLFRGAVELLGREPSFANLDSQVDDLFGSVAKARRIFLRWSTGHKIALHVVASLVASARPRSLIMFDEPEAHLHPPLMAALMHAVRLVLTELNAFCIVATHSPVLLQETLARHVRIIRRVAESIEVTQPALETFGENVGILTYSTFGLTASSTDFHKALDLLITGSDSIEKIDQLFTPGLSGQARAYVLSRWAHEGKAK